MKLDEAPQLIAAEAETLRLDEFAPASPEDWRREAETFLKGAPFEKKLVTRTLEGIALQPIYFAREGEAHESGYRPPSFGGLVAQDIPVGNAAEFNKLLLADLMSGQTCVNLPLDVASRHAQDPEEAVPGEVGQCGVSISTLTDLEIALDQVDLRAAPLNVWAGATALPMLGLVGALAVDRGCPEKSWRGAVLADPLTEWAREGKLDMGLPDAFDDMAFALQLAEAKMPGMRVIGIGASFWADAGCGAVDELAFGLATATEYVREMLPRGITPREAAARMVFGFSLGSQVFMQIAKLRAARQLWAHVLDAFGGGAASVPMVIHGRGSAFSKSSLDPHTNLLRTTSEAFAGMVGGVESLHLPTFDEIYSAPNDFSRRLARNVQVILSEECGLADVADAAGGSWYVEQLTRELAEAAWKRFQEIEALGGMAAALRDGEPQRTALRAAEARYAAVATGREPLVGVNVSANPKETIHALEFDDGEVYRRRRVAEIREIAQKSSGTVTACLKGEAATPSPIDAFLRGWTISQVRRTLPRRAAPEIPILRVQVRRASRGFEALRGRSSAWSATAGKAPSAWLAAFGPPRQHRARADFSTSFLACGGFEAQSGKGAPDVETAVNEAAQSDAPVVVICSTDETYPEIVPAFTKALKSRRPSVRVLLAGNPGENETLYRAAGVNGFLHLKVSPLEFLEELLGTLDPKACR